MIRIKVTDEMVRKLTRSFNPALDSSQAQNAVRMILNVVERDLARRQEIIDDGGTPIQNGCIEDVIS